MNVIQIEYVCILSTNVFLLLLLCIFLFPKSLYGMHILLSETEFLNEVLIQDIFSISAYQLSNLLKFS